MLIPHLHFCGDCKDAIALYEKAFNTKAEAIEYRPDNGKIAHAEMNVHGQLVYLNDNFGNKDKSFDCAVHLIITFRTVDELTACYDVLKAGGSDVGVFHETPYSRLCGNFMDRFGVMWGFMADL